MSQLTYRNSVSTTYDTYDSSFVSLSFTHGKGVCTSKQERMRTREQEREKGRRREREGETKRVTKAAPIALSAPFLEDLLRFCRNPIAPSAIKPESCPVKGWYGGRRARTESVTIGEEREGSSLLAGAWRKGGGKVQRGSGKRRKRRTSVCALLRRTSSSR